MRIGVIATVYNEAESLSRLLDSLLDQSRPPDEIVICDGGSSDGTADLLQDYAGRNPEIKVIIAPGANISQGRNRAIAVSTARVIAVTDAGVRLSPRWLESLTAPFESEETMAVAGFFEPDARNAFEIAMAATVLPLVDEIDPERFLPSSRSVAFLKESWAKAGGYPEWLDYCEDLIFDWRLNDLRPAQKSGFAWAPDALVYFRPRSSLSSFWLQYYRYARGDGKADLWRKRHGLRYATYLLLIPALVGHGLWGRKWPILGWLGLFAGAIVYLARSWQRLLRLWGPLSPGGRVLASFYVPFIRLVGDLAKMCGYPVGLFWRRKHRRQSEIHWRES